MVEKTKRAISILQHRGSDGAVATLQETTMISDIKRQTEEKIAEFRRNAEDAVNQVKYLRNKSSNSVTENKFFFFFLLNQGKTTSSVRDSTSRSSSGNTSYRYDSARKD